MSMGGPSRAESSNGHLLAQRIVTALRDRDFLPAIYPALFTGEIAEGSLHAYMLSAYVLVGDRLAFSPVSDAPVFDRLDKLLIGEGSKRPDALWIDRGGQSIRCLIEFERYSPASLAPKARNLLMMGKEIQGTLDLIVLNYWTYIALPDEMLRETLTIFAHGFRHTVGVAFGALRCPALVVETVVVSQGSGIRIHTVTPRLFVAGGENKTYVVERLNSL